MCVFFFRLPLQPKSNPFVQKEKLNIALNPFEMVSVSIYLLNVVTHQSVKSYAEKSFIIFILWISLLLTKSQVV